MSSSEKLAVFKSNLRKAIEKHESRREIQKSDDELFLEEFTAVNLNGKQDGGDQVILPKFYSTLPPEDAELKQKLREEARHSGLFRLFPAHGPFLPEIRLFF